MTAAGIVLAGGRSSRMGVSKAHLEWHGSTLLRRTAALLGRTVDGPVVVVRAPGQELPPLPAGAEVVEDPVEGRGPLQGIATGLTAVADRTPTAFVCATDLPFLHPAYVRLVLRELDASDDGPVDVVLPHARGHRQPLAAGYRTALAPTITRLVDGGERRLRMLSDHCRVRRIDDAGLLADAALGALDPDLDSVLNVNEPGDYTAARRRVAPEVTVQRCGALAAGGDPGLRRVRAATLGAATAAVRLTLDRRVVTVLNGDRTTCDAELPLVTGDVVTFLFADP